MDEVEVRTAAQIGAVVRRLRQDRNWSQRELAEIAGVSRVFVSQLENGKARAEMRLVLALLQALDASLVISQSETGSETGAEPDLLADQPW